MKRFGPWLEWLDGAVRGTRWAGVAGTAMLVFAAAFWFNGNRAQREDLVRVGLHALALQARLDRPVENPGLSPRARLAAFYGRLPHADGLPDVLLKFHDLAAKHGVLLERAEFREQRKSHEPVTRVTLVFPARASYPQLRGWLAAVAAQMPGAALQEIRLRRNAIGSEQLDAELRFVVMLGRQA